MAPAMMASGTMSHSAAAQERGRSSTPVRLAIIGNTYRYGSDLHQPALGIRCSWVWLSGTHPQSERWRNNYPCSRLLR